MDLLLIIFSTSLSHITAKKGSEVNPTLFLISKKKLELQGNTC